MSSDEIAMATPGAGAATPPWTPATRGDRAQIESGGAPARKAGASGNATAVLRGGEVAHHQRSSWPRRLVAHARLPRAERRSLRLGEAG